MLSRAGGEVGLGIGVGLVGVGLNIEGEAGC